MKLKLLDYHEKATNFDVGDIKDIKQIFVTVMSGDEVATVLYKDGTQKEFDSGTCRLMGFYDGQYELFSCDKSDNLLFTDFWRKRDNSYQVLYRLHIMWYELEKTEKEN